MDAIEQLYRYEKKNGLKYYDTLRLTFLLHLEYLYSENNISKKGIDDLVKELGIRSKYTKVELGVIINNAVKILEIKYNINILNMYPLSYEKKKRKLKK